jgi:hypothetical protein
VIVTKPEKILLTVFWNDGRVRRVQRKQMSRISAVLRWIKESEVKKYYLRVSYPVVTDNFNQVITPINEGEYLNRDALMNALRCFA